LLGQLGLADARRPGEEEAAYRTAFVADPGLGDLDGLYDRVDGFVLSNDDALQGVLEAAQGLGLRAAQLGDRNLGHLGDQGV
jgi:hypothetical protein